MFDHISDAHTAMEFHGGRISGLCDFTDKKTNLDLILWGLLKTEAIVTPGIKRNERRHSRVSYKEPCPKYAGCGRDSQSIRNKESKMSGNHSGSSCIVCPGWIWETCYQILFFFFSFVLKQK
jgi:hypothetical protein